MKSLEKEEHKFAYSKMNVNKCIDDNSYDMQSNSGHFVQASLLPRENKHKSMPLLKSGELEPLNKQIKILYKTNKFIRLINSKETVGKVLLKLKEFLQRERYIDRDSNCELYLKDNEGFILDNEIVCDTTNLNQIFEVCDCNANSINRLTGSLENMDIPNSVLDIKNEYGNWLIKLSWNQRKDGTIPASTFVSEDLLIKFQPKFLFDFYSTFTKSIIGNKK